MYLETPHEIMLFERIMAAIQAEREPLTDAQIVGVLQAVTQCIHTEQNKGK